MTGHSAKEINFRNGPGLQHEIIHSIDQSNLLVILPGEEKNGFVEAFDVETSTLGYVYRSLIQVTDSLDLNQQKIFAERDSGSEGDVEIVLVNRIQHPLFVWINDQSYQVLPNQKITLVLSDTAITYFASTPGAFPIYGKEVLEKGISYRWQYSL